MLAKLKWFKWVILAGLGYNLFSLGFYVYDWFVNGMRDERAQRGLVVFGLCSLLGIASFLLTRHLVRVCR